MWPFFLMKKGGIDKLVEINNVAWRPKVWPRQAKPIKRLHKINAQFNCVAENIT